MRRALLHIVLAAAFAPAACTGHEASPVGVELLPGDVLGTLRVAISTAFARAVDFAVFPADRARADRLTTAHDWPAADGFESRALIRFGIADLDSLPARTVFENPQLRLVFVSPGSEVTVAVHRVTSAWDEEAATWERRDFGQPWARAGGDFDPVPIGRFTIRPLPPDTVAADSGRARADSIRVPIPADLFTGWRSGRVPNDGLMLIQETPGAAVDFVAAGDPAVGLNANGPTLEVEATLPDTTPAALRMLAREDVFVAVDESPFPPGGLVVRGVEPPRRAVLEPTLEDVPAGAGVTSVQLVLTIRAVDIPRDSLLLFAVSPVTPFRGENTVFAPFLTALAFAVVKPTAQPGDTVALEAPQLTRLVRLWLRDPDTNRGLGLRLPEGGTAASSEVLFFGGVQFYGLEAPEELRPRLRVLFVPSAAGGP